MPYSYSGSCHCRNIKLEIVLTERAGLYYPRACDCKFCQVHAASYISDPDGKMEIHVKDDNNLSKYRQGSGVAEFLICKICGVLVGITYLEDEHLYGTINSKAIGGVAFGAEITVSPKMLNEQDKIERWKSIWFRNVSIREYGI